MFVGKWEAYVLMSPTFKYFLDSYKITTKIQILKAQFQYFGLSAEVKNRSLSIIYSVDKRANLSCCFVVWILWFLSIEKQTKAVLLKNICLYVLDNNVSLTFFILMRDQE